MGSVAHLRAQDAPIIEQSDAPWMQHVDGNGFKSFKMLGLAADQPSAPTGMKDEILLLSWLIVLLRTREDSQICYEWAYKSHCGGDIDPVSVRLSADDVMTGLPSQVGEVAAAISRHIATLAPRPPPTVSTAPVSLI